MAERINIENTDLDGEVHFLEKHDYFIERILCYPQKSCSELENRLKTLINRGFIYILETGSSIHGLRILGKGYSSVVVAAKHSSHGIGSLKILRTDSRRSSLVKEGEIMSRALELNILPRLIFYEDLFIFYELLPPHMCKPYTSFLETLVLSNKISQITSLLKYTLESMYKLDELKVDHTELNRPNGHMLYCSGELKILDWESARMSIRPANVSSFVSFLLFRFKHSYRLKYVLNYDVDKVLKALKNYKRHYSKEAFIEVMHSLCLG